MVPWQQVFEKFGTLEADKLAAMLQARQTQHVARGSDLEQPPFFCVDEVISSPVLDVSMDPTAVAAAAAIASDQA